MFSTYRVRPVVEITAPDGEISYHAFDSLAEAERDVAEFEARISFLGREGHRVVWSIYGIENDANGGLKETQISDAFSKESAEKLLECIIGPFTEDQKGLCKRKPDAIVKVWIAIGNKFHNSLEFASDAEYRAFLTGCIELRDIITNFGTARKVEIRREGEPPILLTKSLQTEQEGPAQVAKCIMARFVPEAWINNYSVEIDGAVEFDVTEAILAMPPSQRDALRDNTNESDNLVPDRILTLHSGPFRVEIEQAIEDYFADLPSER